MKQKDPTDLWKEDLAAFIEELDVGKLGFWGQKQSISSLSETSLINSSVSSFG